MSSHKLAAMAPGALFVIELAVAETTVQDADQAVRECS
jgi:hypothetical protein